MSNRLLEAFLKFKQVDSDSCIIENRIEIFIFLLFDKLPQILPTNIDGLELPMSQWRENTLLHM